METQMTLNEFERRLIELVRTLPEALTQQVMALAIRLKESTSSDGAQLHEERVAYGVSVAPHETATDDEVQAIIQRSFKEHQDVWAELAKH